MEFKNQMDNLLKEHPHLKDFYPMLMQLNKESHRGAVVLSCSYLEQLLGDIISAFLIQTKETEKLLEGFNAPLGTLSARATLAYALGLINEREYKEINSLKKIRNAFAHKFKATFDDPGIKDLCKELDYRARDYDNVILDSAAQYNTAAIALILNLTNRAHYVSRKRLKTESWSY